MVTGGDGVRLLESGERPQWDELVEEAAREPYFAARDWIDHVAAAVGGEAEIVGAFRAGHLLGGVALPVRRRMGLRVATPPHLQPYLEVVTRESRTRVLRDILPWIARRHPLVFLLPPPGEEDLRAYRRERWDLAYRYTLRLHLAGADEEGLLAGLERSQKRRVRRAADGDAEVRTTEDPEAHSALVLSSYRSQNKKFPLSRENGRELVRWVIASGRGRLFELRRGGTVVASLLTGLRGRRAYSLESGLDRERAGGGDAPYLQFQALLRLAEEGIEEFDFLGVNHPTISRFKESFGGRLVRYHAAVPHRGLGMRAVLRLSGGGPDLEISSDGARRGG
ncbi:MAG: GNAT family N-acetyltransferase [Candidatus Eisenbacteria bacterium]